MFTTFVVAFSVPGVFEGGKGDLDNQVVSTGSLLVTPRECISVS